MIITRPEVRRWIYGVATAALAILGVYGLVNGEQVAAWTGVALAVTGLATVNTPASGQMG